MKTILAALCLFVGTCTAECGDAPLEIRLKRVPATGVISNRFEVTIRNASDGPLSILKPVNGSMWSWYLPFYAFHVSDAGGVSLKMARRHFISGLYPGTRWPDDYLVVLKPGEAYVRCFDLLFSVPESGDYTVRFDYVMDPAKDRYKGKLLEYPAQAWKGTASSKPAKFRLAKQQL